MDDGQIEGLRGTMKKSGNFVFPVPLVYRNKIREVRIVGALGRLLELNPRVFCVIIPADALDPDRWRVSVDLKGGMLCIAPPKEIVGLKGMIGEPQIGLVLPWGIPINDQPGQS